MKIYFMLYIDESLDKDHCMLQKWNKKYIKVIVCYKNGIKNT